MDADKVLVGSNNTRRSTTLRVLAAEAEHRGPWAGGATSWLLRNNAEGPVHGGGCGG